MAGIYLHIPFCRQACTYCNFHFSTLQKNKPEVLNAMIREIGLQQHFFPLETTIETIYFGGGTPSLLEATEINLFMEEIRKYFKVKSDVEITLEANPDDLSKDYLERLKKETEVNRLSIGVQSFFEEDLQYMHRAHNAKDAVRSIEDAKTAGFTNVSVDLIYGTPTMNDERWKENLQILFSLDIPHISSYALTVEEKTALADQIKKHKTVSPSDEQTARQFSILLEAMQQNGFTHYEISNFCREPHFAVHNTNYWKGVPYLGIGPSAHSFDGKKRYWNVSNNGIYAKKVFANELANEFEILSPVNRYNEYVMTSIRTIWGTDIHKIEKEFDEDFKKHFLFEVSPFISNDWVKEKNGIYKLSNSGKLFCDYITENLFMD